MKSQSMSKMGTRKPRTADLTLLGRRSQSGFWREALLGCWKAACFVTMHPEIRQKNEGSRIQSILLPPFYCLLLGQFSKQDGVKNSVLSVVQNRPPKAE